MGIINTMTIAAGLRRLKALGCTVALRTGNRLMFAKQVKIRLAMIERGYSPHRCLMTAFAARPQFALMRVTGLVAGIAFGRGVPVRFTRFMTRGTGKTGVRPVQWKIRQAVIKEIRLKVNNVAVPTLVFRVAAAAVARLNTSTQPMKARSPFNI